MMGGKEVTMKKGAGRLTLEEKRSIIRLFENGTSITKIREQTGRSREAIVGLLGDVGLYDNEVTNRAWRRARYLQDRIQRGLPYEKRTSFRNLNPADQEAFFREAKKQLLEAAKVYYNSIMEANTIKELDDRTQQEDAVSNLVRTTKTLDNIVQMTKAEPVKTIDAIFLVLSDIAITLSVIADNIENGQTI